MYYGVAFTNYVKKCVSPLPVLLPSTLQAEIFQEDSEKIHGRDSIASIEQGLVISPLHSVNKTMKGSSGRVAISDKARKFRAFVEYNKWW